MKGDSVNIVYRCDSKYLYFLNNSIHSLVKTYKDTRKLNIYITTNDEIIKELPFLDKLKKYYDFNYHIVRIDEKFFETHPTLKDFKHLAKRKFLGFRKEFHYAKNLIFNNTTRPYNPFAKSKLTQLLSGFFILNFEGDKILSLDTDTIIVSNITELYDYNINDYYCAACRDWVDYHTFSPSVFLCNVKKWHEVFFHKNGLFNTFVNATKASDFTKESFGDQVQHATNIAIGDKWLEVDSTWNVPITHIFQYQEPKLYHFSESWSGKHNVLNTYEKVLAKYVQTDQIHF